MSIILSQVFVSYPSNHTRPKKRKAQSRPEKWRREIHVHPSMMTQSLLAALPSQHRVALPIRKWAYKWTINKTQKWVFLMLSSPKMSDLGWTDLYLFLKFVNFYWSGRCSVHFLKNMSFKPAPGKLGLGPHPNMKASHCDLQIRLLPMSDLVSYQDVT